MAMGSPPSGPSSSETTSSHRALMRSDLQLTPWEDHDELERTRPLNGIDETATFHGSTSNVKIPVVTVLPGRSLGRVIKMDSQEVFLGRGSHMQIVLADTGISRCHAKLYKEGDDIFVTDLNSTNGTFVNDTRIETKALLKAGDYIRVGIRTVLRFGYQDTWDEKIREKLYELATRDPLTNAYNRRYFDERFAMEWAWSRRHQKPCALLAIDVDHFKILNDTHGHGAGDFVLAQLVARLRALLRAEDTLARAGGEEFFLLARATDQQTAKLLGERVRQVIANAIFDCNGKLLNVTVSVGVCTSDHHQASAMEDMVSLADKALYEAKNSGRNRVCFA
jgi:two-component system, cell cycle response regulator